MDELIFLVSSGFLFLVGIFMAFKTFEKIRNNESWNAFGFVSSIFISTALMLSIVTIALGL